MMKSSYRFTITETEPIPLVRDFQSFLEYIETKKPNLTPKGHISGKDLFEMNKLMTYPLEGMSPRTGQEYYPQLHFFFHLAQAGRITHKAQGRGNKINLQNSQQTEKYNGLTPTDRHFSISSIMAMNGNFRYSWKQSCLTNLFLKLLELLKSRARVPSSIQIGRNEN